MKKKMGLAKSSPTKVLHKDKGMGGMEMLEIESMKIFKRLTFFIKEWRRKNEMAETMFEALTCLEREIEVKTSRATREGISIDHASNSWWKSTMQCCVKNKACHEAFDETWMSDEEAFVEVTSNKGITKKELRVMNCLRIKWKTWKMSTGMINTQQ